MLKRGVSSVLSALVLTTFLSGCYAMNHTVGSGAQGSQEETKRIWFALYGLIPITDYDSQQLAKGAKDYSVKTEQTFVDILISLVTGIVTVVPWTVEVRK